MLDSHAHYTHKCYENTFSYLAYGPEGYILETGSREDLFRALQRAGVQGWVEPGITLASNQAALTMAEKFPLYPAVGLHPTRAPGTPWRGRKQLAAWSQDPRVVAIGETGLDFHHPRKEQHRTEQLLWFCYQLGLARRRQLPLILHIRSADAQALRVLRHYRGYGGVVHCFSGDWATAKAYLDLGYHLGIGGALLQAEDRAAPLWEAVQQAPLARLLLETDSPYVLPDCKAALGGKKLRRVRNTSLILPAVAEKVGALKGLTAEEVLLATGENTRRLFRLPARPQERSDL